MRDANGFFDIQVNGYAGCDFNRDGLTGDSLHAACARLRADGTAAVLAAIVTDDVDRMAARIAALAALRRADSLVREVIAGVHLEGPFINETAGYRGAHPLDAVLPASTLVMEKLLAAGDGLVRMVTLAPERDEAFAVIRMLVRAGVRVAAGHTDASLDCLRAAADEGISVFTHLGNGCPMQLPRHDNIIQRALSLRDRLWLCFIADGHHIPFFALGNYLRCAGADRSIVVTDATAASGAPPGRYTLGRWEIEIGPERVAMAPDGSHLVGSAATMADCRDNLLRHLGLSQTDADRLIRINPQAALGL